MASEKTARDLHALVDVMKQMLDLWVDAELRRGRDCATATSWSENTGKLCITITTGKKYDPELCAPWWDMKQLEQAYQPAMQADLSSLNQG